MADWMRRLLSSSSNGLVTVVGVMDRDSWTARTDNIVIVDARHHRLTWIARDLWSDAVGDRINEAYARGGHDLLMLALRELGWPVTSSVVLLRSAIERALRDLCITVAVQQRRRYFYPMSPLLPIEDGAKIVEFTPPKETLTGERIHQWIGARSSADWPRPALPDLDRIARQQVFLRQLIESGFNFRVTLADASRVDISGDEAMQALSSVHAGWDMRTFDQVEPVTRDGKQVLVHRRGVLARLRRPGAR